jgi:hypothetical protein
MNRSILKVNVLIGFALFSSLFLFSQNINAKRYEVESAKVDYQVKSLDGEGSKSLKFDRYGMREVVHEVLRKNGKVIKDELTIINGDHSYVIDLLKKKGVDISGMTKASMQMTAPKNGSYSAMGKDMLKQMGGQMVGHENFLGKDCEKWNLKMMGNIDMLIWKGVVLKTESKIMGMKMLEKAESIKTGVTLSDAELQIPKGVALDREQSKMMPFGEDMEMSPEEKQDFQKLMNMSYDEYRKMVKQGDPNVSEEEIKQSYEMMKKMGDIFK